MKLLEVLIWDQLVGVLAWDQSSQVCSFEYADSFIRNDWQLSPLVNLKSKKIIEANPFSTSSEVVFDTEKGLPLFISDSLPDKFGTQLFSKFLEKEGKSYRDLTPIEKLAYIGARGMGALEFRPAKHEYSGNDAVNIKKLHALSASLMKNKPIANISDLANLFHIGTSPGGAQPKVLINIDRYTGDIFRGDVLSSENQDSWILKFNRDTGEHYDQERGKIEYVYYLMARDAGIDMMESRLLPHDGEYYFMTKRFDRVGGNKLHTQTLHAFAGMNFKLPNTYSYEQIFSVFNSINLDYTVKEQLFRIMVFNVIGCNVDDHTKNFGFNMNQTGEWNFSPAYDLTFSYNENYNRVTPHFLSINGKNEDFKLSDILALALEFNIKHPKKIINEVNSSFRKWEFKAQGHNISKKTMEYIASKLNRSGYLIG